MRLILRKSELRKVGTENVSVKVIDLSEVARLDRKVIKILFNCLQNCNDN